MESERGPLEQELYDLIRKRGLSDPDFLNLQVANSKTIPTDEAARMALRMGPTWMEAILRLAKEIDQLHSSSG